MAAVPGAGIVAALSASLSPDSPADAGDGLTSYRSSFSLRLDTDCLRSPSRVAVSCPEWLHPENAEGWIVPPAIPYAGCVEGVYSPAWVDPLVDVAEG